MQGTIALWLAIQVHTCMCVCVYKLPKVVIWEWNNWWSNQWPLSCESNAVTIKSPHHTVIQHGIYLSRQSGTATTCPTNQLQSVVYWGYTRVYGVYQPPGFFWQRILTSATINKQGTFRPFATPLSVYPPPVLAIHHWLQCLPGSETSDLWVMNLMP